MKNLFKILLVLCMITMCTAVTALADELPNLITVSDCDLSAMTVTYFGDENQRLYVAVYDDDGNLENVYVGDEGEKSVKIPTSDSSNIRAFSWNENQKPVTQSYTAKSVTLSAENIVEDKSDENTLYFYIDGSNKQKKYQLADDCMIYVNGVVVSMDASEFAQYMAECETATITMLEDENGKYNKIYAVNYVTAVVDDITISNMGININFMNQSGDIENSFLSVCDNSNIKYSFKLNGEEIDAAELKQYDVLSIKYNESLSFDTSDFYDVIVTRNTFSGKLLAINVDDGIYNIDDNEYKVSAGTKAHFIPIGKDCIYYLDLFGRIAYAKELSNEKNIAILTNIYQSANSDYVAVIITNNGEEEYNVDANKAEEYQDLIKDKEDYECVVEYRISRASGKLTVMDNIIGTAAENEVYDETSNSIGNIKMSDKTVIIDSQINNYNIYRTVSLKNLKDGYNYTAYGYDKNEDGTYNFVIIKDGTIVEQTFGILTYMDERHGYVGIELIDDSLDLLLLNDDTGESFSAKIQQLIDEKTIDERVVYVEFGNNTLLEFDTVEPITYSGVYTDGKIDVYDINSDILTFKTWDYGDIIPYFISKKCFVDGEEYTVDVYVKDGNELAVVKSGRIDLELMYDLGIVKTVYQHANGSYMAIIVNETGEEVEYKIDDDAYDKYLELVKDGVDENNLKDLTIFYKVVNDKVRVIKDFVPEGVAVNGTYRSQNNTIGNIKLSPEKTNILDLRYGYFRKFDLSNLKDGTTYTGLEIGKFVTGESRLFVVTSGDILE